MIWPAWVDIVLGGLGLIWCLDTWGKLRTREPWHPQLVPSTTGLTIFSVALIVIGVLPWPGGYSSKASAQNAIDSIKANGPKAPVEDNS